MKPGDYVEHKFSKKIGKILEVTNHGVLVLTKELNAVLTFWNFGFFEHKEVDVKECPGDHGK